MQYKKNAEKNQYEGVRGLESWDAEQSEAVVIFSSGRYVVQHPYCKKLGNFGIEDDRGRNNNCERDSDPPYCVQLLIGPDCISPAMRLTVQLANRYHHNQLCSYLTMGM